MTDEPDDPPRVVVWVRELSVPPGDPREAVLSRLGELESRGLVADVSLRVWGATVDAAVVDGGEFEQPVRSCVAEFHRWAERTGHSLEPAFRREQRSSMLSTERSAVVRLPRVCVAVYTDGGLRGVFPCSPAEEAGTETVWDCLDRLGAGAAAGKPLE
ncbi:uncharacterized protein Nmlp_1827 [Natronomonas moolapensis 8.8.11]|uniref:Uncharacterized protein n=1 Tax=Natronomonas moolapensis (strain DSM 18674 / CECT 7526 / JCM 14361 / 8.8.11) TaxID=268739 RepID=M1XPM8_NATM8|nr:HTH domain-containing protein [Natronomonas moolapensis]CCQ36015.1 uncharacterized protein Nmlp_1827 [Natronomonas moolapensis 8.8.11]